MKNWNDKGSGRKGVDHVNDRLIDVGIENAYFIGIVGLFTLTGGLFTFQLLPAYDPSSLAQPFWVVWVEYAFGLFLGGLLAVLSLFRSDRLKGLRQQQTGLYLQGGSALISLLTAVYWGHEKALFIVVWGAALATMHGFRLFFLRREIRNVPIKRRVAAAVPVAGAGDLTVSALEFLQHRVTTLESALAAAEGQG